MSAVEHICALLPGETLTLEASMDGKFAINDETRYLKKGDTWLIENKGNEILVVNNISGGRWSLDGGGKTSKHGAPRSYKSV